MMKTVALILLTAILVLCTACQSKSTDKSLNATQTFEVKDTLESVQAEKTKVVILYGQSNATGISLNAYLKQKSPADYAEAEAGYDNILINFITENGANSSGGAFVPTKLGQGGSENHFGPEVGIASALTARYPGEKIFIIKYSWGGSILFDQWLDGEGGKGELYTAAINFTRTSLAYLKSKGYAPEIEAVCWMQGESDAFYENRANTYFDNTKNFVSYLREDLKDYASDPFSFIDAGIAEIDLWVNPKVVNDAKLRFAESDEHNYYFSTAAMGLTTNLEPEGEPDRAHFDAQSELALGKKFGKYIIG